MKLAYILTPSGATYVNVDAIAYIGSARKSAWAEGDKPDVREVYFIGGASLTMLDSSQNMTALGV